MMFKAGWSCDYNCCVDVNEVDRNANNKDNNVFWGEYFG